MVKPNINQRAIPVKQSQKQRNCPGDRYYQVILFNDKSIFNFE